jgi:hypothetical protein
MLHIRNYLCPQNVQTSSMTHPVSHLADPAGGNPGGKATKWGSPRSYQVPRVPLHLRAFTECSGATLLLAYWQYVFEEIYFDLYRYSAASTSVLG